MKLGFTSFFKCISHYIEFDLYWDTQHWTLQVRSTQPTETYCHIECILHQSWLFKA